MNIKTITVGFLATNCYLVSNGKDAVIIDPGWDAGKILKTIEEENVKVHYIFLTHGHYDHILAAAAVKEVTGAKVVIAEADGEMLESSSASLAVRAEQEQKPITADVLAADGDLFKIGGMEFEYMHTPGHTPGSSVIITGNVIFSGDTLFAGDCGRCDLPGGSLSDMKASLKKLYMLDGDYYVLPGHDEQTTLAAERKQNKDMLEAISK